jgi:hypothetical protein
MLECFFCSEAWLVKMDAQMKVIRPIFAKTYGEGEVTKWIANWRMVLCPYHHSVGPIMLLRGQD